MEGLTDLHERAMFEQKRRSWFGDDQRSLWTLDPVAVLRTAILGMGDLAIEVKRGPPSCALRWHGVRSRRVDAGHGRAALR